MSSFKLKNYIAAKFSRWKIGSENVIRTSLTKVSLEFTQLSCLFIRHRVESDAVDCWTGCAMANGVPNEED